MVFVLTFLEVTLFIIIIVINWIKWKYGIMMECPTWSEETGATKVKWLASKIASKCLTWDLN